MHGLIFSELRKYVVAKLGDPAWESLLHQAGLGSRVYVISDTYPDAEVVALVSTASKITGLTAGVILEDFGEFIVPSLLTTYKSFIKPGWRTLDLLEHTEQTIHRAVRMRDRGADPPKLQVTRTSPTEVVIVYASPRKLCAVAKGIAKGIAKHYGDTIAIRESGCMNAGYPACTIHVQQLT